MHFFVFGALLVSLAILDAIPIKTADAKGGCEDVRIRKTATNSYLRDSNPWKITDNKENTKWLAAGNNAWIRANLGEQKTICFVEISWFKGNLITYNFAISVSDTRGAYTHVYSGKSSGMNERYDFKDIDGQYVKVTIKGAIAGINELDVYGQSNGIDNTKPTIGWIPNLKVEGKGLLTNVPLRPPVVIDDTYQSLKLVNDAPAGGFKVGTTKVTWTATDASGNSAKKVQLVTVTDYTKPLIRAPKDIVVKAGEETSRIELGMPIVKDVIDRSLVITNDAPAGGFKVGTTKVTWTATDASGNSATDTQSVTVLQDSKSAKGKKLHIQIFAISNDDKTQKIIKDRLDSDDSIANFRLPVLGKYNSPIRMLDEASIEDIKSAIRNEIPKSKVKVDYITYDNEGWSLTPRDEQKDPAGSTNKAAKIVRDAGYKFAVAPTHRMLSEQLYGVDWSKVDFLTMQLQKLVNNDKFHEKATTISKHVRSQNPDILIVAQVNPELHSIKDIVKEIDGIRDSIDGVAIVWKGTDAAKLDRLLEALGR